MARIIEPSRESLCSLRTPLRDGEWAVLDFFDRYLSPSWEIYVQPHLNGLRPDFVLLHPGVGIAVFEVKDWNLSGGNYGYDIDKHGAAEFRVRDGRGNEGRGYPHDPVAKMRVYHDEIFELYCPRLDRKAGQAVITSGLIFTQASDNEVKAFVWPALQEDKVYTAYPHKWPIVGASSLAAGNIACVFPESLRFASKYMNETCAADLRNWLREPSAASDQREVPRLDARQRPLAMERTETGFRRIRGAAGAGKSLVLAARVAQLCETNDVLVLTYNITLLNYLQDLAVRWPAGRKARQRVTWLNFHAWCKRVCMQVGAAWEYRQLWVGSDGRDEREYMLKEGLAELVLRLLSDERRLCQCDTYDAILVDEGQDFRPSWWSAVRKVRRDGGEMMLVADATQDLYGTSARWTDEAMTGAGFRGDWSRLEGSYRIPPVLIPKIRAFAERYIPEKTRELPTAVQLDLNEGACKTIWYQVPPEDVAIACAHEVLLASSRHAGTGANADVVFLASSNALGRNVLAELDKRGIRMLHTFDENDRHSRQQKLSFFLGDARIKGTTPHSFKGWESRTLVVGIEPFRSSDGVTATYVAITRLKRDPKGSVLVVVSAEQSLAEFGATWTKSLSF